MAKVTISSYQSLQRYAEKQIDKCYNPYMLKDALDKINKAFTAYCAADFKAVEVEE